MNAQRIIPNFSLLGLEWVARFGSIISIALLFALFIGEGFHPSQVAPKEWIALLFFPVGVIVGMMIAWWREGVGAVVAVGSLIAFYFVYGYVLRNHIGGWAFVMFAAPGFLFLLHWFLLRTGEKQVLR